jgi:hypothetical protein
MEKMYRFTFKSDDYELQLESTDEKFVTTQMGQLVSLATKQSKHSTGTEAIAKIKKEVPFELVNVEAAKSIAEKDEDAPALSKKKGRPAGSPNKMAKAASEQSKSTNHTMANLDAVKVADTIKNSEEYAVIEEKILGRANQLNKILMACYYVNKVHGKKPVTTSFLEELFDHLGKKMAKSNIGTKMKNSQDAQDGYFKLDDEQKRGTPTQYRITKKGIETYEALIRA